MPGRRGKRLPDEVKRAAVDQVIKEGRHPTEVAKDVGVSRQAIYLWVERFTSDNPERVIGRPKHRPLNADQRETLRKTVVETKPSDHGIEADPDMWGLGAAKEFLSQTFRLNYTFRYIYETLADVGVHLPRSMPAPGGTFDPAIHMGDKSSIPKRRGRPPKPKTAEELAAAAAPKKRPGRPRKNALPSEAPASDEAAPKKKRGRPPKNPVSQDAPPAPKKKRGRPRKEPQIERVTVAAAPALPKSEEIVEDIERADMSMYEAGVKEAQTLMGGKVKKPKSARSGPGVRVGKHAKGTATARKKAKKRRR